MTRESTSKLLDAFEIWTTAASDNVDLDVAELLLDLKSDFGAHRDPRRWEHGEVSKLLLDVLPRKVMLEDAPAESTAPALKAFLRFMDGSRRMHRSSAGLTALLAEVDEASASYAAAMVDPQRAGLAKTMISAMLADGVDVTDQDAVRRWQEKFNARPHEERIALTGGSQPGWTGVAPGDRSRFGDASPFDGGAAEDRTMPMVRLAPSANLAAAARGCPTLRDADRLVNWVGDRRAVTSTGALRPQDARTAVNDLGFETDAPLLDGIRTAWELPRLSEVWQVAELTTMLELSATRVVPGPRRSMLVDGDDGSVLDAWSTAFEAVVANTGVDGVVDEVAEAADQIVPMLLLAPCSAGGPVSLAEMADLMREMLLEQLGNRLPPMSTVDMVVGQVPRMLESWVRMGAVEIAHDGLALTPLGVFGAQRILSEMGFGAPVMADPAELSAMELLDQLGELADEDVDVAVEDWLDSRKPVEGASELLSAARQSTPLVRGLAFQLLDAVGEPAVEVVRGGLSNLPLRPYAAVWLEAHGHPASVSAEDLQWMLVDVCVGLLEAGDADALVEQVAQLGTAEEQVDMLGDAWRSGHPQSADVLEALGRAHPAPKVAKAARKGAFKARSAR